MLIHVVTLRSIPLLPSRAAHNARSEDCRGETVAVELRRQYHCAAYNCNAAIISCVQTDTRFYRSFLFTENESKVDTEVYAKIYIVGGVIKPCI